METANDTYSVAIAIWSLGAVVASLECNGLPVYKEEWKTDAVAWIRAVQNHVIRKYNKRGGELLWFLIESMLVEDPDKRSSADYVHDQALELLQSMANNKSDDEVEGSATPTPSMLSAQSAVESEDAGDLHIQPAPNGSKTPIRDQNLSRAALSLIHH